MSWLRFSAVAPRRVVSGHVGQAVLSHTDYVYGGSVRLKSFTVRGLYLNDEPAERKMYFQAGFHLPLRAAGHSPGRSVATCRRSI